MPIFFHSEKVNLPKFNPDNLRNWIKYCIISEKFTCETINIIFTNDTQLIEINKKYLGRDYYTDIICFDYCQENSIIGDLYISLDKVEANAKTYNINFSNELNRVIIHGILHLLKYNDQEEIEKKIMKEKENYYLDIFDKNFSIQHS